MEAPFSKPKINMVFRFVSEITHNKINILSHWVLHIYVIELHDSHVLEISFSL